MNCYKYANNVVTIYLPDIVVGIIYSKEVA